MSGFDMARVRTRLLLDHPFLGTGAMHVTLIPDPSIPRARTNGVWVRYNPAYMESLSPSEQVFILAHEINHNLLRHPYRRGSRDPEDWNRACDFVVNAQLVESGLTAPADVLLDPEYDGMYAEQVYSKLRSQIPPPPADPKPDQPKPEKGEDEDGAGEGDEGTPGEGEGGEEGTPSDQGAPGQGGEGDEEGPAHTDQMDETEGEGEGDAGETGGGDEENPTGDFVDGPITAEEDGDLTASDWTVIAEEAAMVASTAGQLPGGMARAVKQAREAQVDWTAELRPFLSNVLASDEVCWAHPNRRLISRGIYLPGPFKENVGVLVFGVDVSGSVTQDLFDTFSSELSAVLREVRPEKLIVLCIDTEVRAVYEFLPDQDCEVKLQMTGGGGTAFQPVFDYVEENLLDPLAVVYLTDLDGPWPTEPRYPVLWVSPLWSSKPAPFGTLIRIP